tara:strand:+ start:54 stop:407 length:354 start_codon:yes stop_codon:yes gene_type:complete
MSDSGFSIICNKCLCSDFNIKHIPCIEDEKAVIQEENSIIKCNTCGNELSINNTQTKKYKAKPSKLDEAIDDLQFHNDNLRIYADNPNEHMLNWEKTIENVRLHCELMNRVINKYKA